MRTRYNTGKEMPQTLDFVQECGERWGLAIVWLEQNRGRDAFSRGINRIYPPPSGLASNEGSRAFRMTPVIAELGYLIIDANLRAAWINAMP